MVVQWFPILASTAGGMGSIPSWGTKTLPAAAHSQKKPYSHNTCSLLQLISSGFIMMQEN